MLQVISSHRMTYRYAGLIKNKIYYFGHPDIATYLDGIHPNVRTKYIELCMQDKYKSVQIQNLIPSTCLLDYYILWGHSKNIDVNITHLNALLCKKYKGIDYYY